MTKTGWGFVALFLGVGLIGGITTHAQLYFRLSTFAALTLIVSYIWASISLTGLELSVRNRSNKAHVGEVFDQVITVTNRSFLPMLYLEINDMSGLYGGPGSRLITWIGPKQTRAYTSHLRLVRRGFFEVGKKQVRSGDPLRFYSRTKEFAFKQDLIVYPAFFELGNVDTSPDILKDGRLIHKRSIEPSIQFSEIRPYVPGDDLQKIHWLTSRKFNKLMVKEFDQYMLEESWCVIDANKENHWSLENDAPSTDPWVFTRKDLIQLPKDTFEYSMAIGACLIHQLLKKDIPTGLLATTKEAMRLSPEIGSRQESKLMEVLALANADGKRTLVEMVTQLTGGIRPGSTVYLVTTNSTDELMPALMCLLGHKCHPIVIHVSAGIAAEVDQRSNGTLKSNVRVCQIPLGADIRLLLGKFMSEKRIHQYA